MSRALQLDLYEITMASSYLRRSMVGPATFSLSVRRLPEGWGYLVAGGLEDCLAYLEDMSFLPDDLAYLDSVGIDAETLRVLSTLRFTGDVWAVPEGTVVFAGEPLLEVTAPLPEAQLVETYLLNMCTFQTAVATKATRCMSGASGRIALVDFSLRRTQGMDAGLSVARLSAMCGFVGTSNVEAARRFGLEPSGTMAHSYVEAFEDEQDAFASFAHDHPKRATFLVDTYDPMEGVRRAIQVIGAHGLESTAALRIDSGDLGALARSARSELDRAGLAEVRIFVSGGLDEHDLARFVAAGDPIDAAGVGTRLGVVADAPYIDSTYKLVEYAGRSVAKLSTGKATLPGAKQVLRGLGYEDRIARRGEEPAPGEVPLLELVMRSGERTRPAEPLSVGRERVAAALSCLPASVRALVGAVAPEPAPTEALQALTDEVWAAARDRSGAGSTGP
ncbi:MAG: nicotinate phosphoribosyltransferase [Acidimicrobiales bacterium]